MGFVKAKRSQTKLRMALDGPSGAGKTFTGLRFAFALAQSIPGGGQVGVICSENGSAQKYQGEAPDGVPWDFEISVLKNYAPTSYTQEIKEAARQGFDVLLIDSLSHEWAGSGGALQLKDAVKGGNDYTKWKDITPIHDQMVEAILTSPLHVIATMRSKTDYILEDDGKGKMAPKKIGMGAVQRPGVEYEFDIYASLDLSHVLRVTKSRCSAVDGAVSVCPTGKFMAPVIAWLNSGVPTQPTRPVADQLGQQIGMANSLKALADIWAGAKTLRSQISTADWNDLAAAEKAKRDALKTADLAARQQQPAATPPTEAPPTDVVPPSTNGVHKPVDPPAATVPPPPPTKATAEQLQQLATYRPHWYLSKGHDTPDKQKAAWAELLKPYGVGSAKDLTQPQAAELVNALAPF